MGIIITPKRNIVTLGLQSHVGLEGYYTLSRVNKFSGKVIEKLGPFKNLILNQGLINYFGTPSMPIYNGGNITYNNGSMYGGMSVGTGNSTPAVTDVRLANWRATTSSTGHTYSYVAASGQVPAYWSYVYNYQFATGIAAGNLSEIGTFPSTLAMTNLEYPYLSSRSLIVDSNGNPTTITVLSDEMLTATYEIRFYLNTADNSFTVNLNGSPITGVYRLESITSPPSHADWSLYNNGADDYFSTYSGNIVPVTSSPTGNYANSASILDQIVNDISNSGTCYMDRHTIFNTSQGVGPINSIVCTGIMWKYQFGNFSTAINKTSGQQFQVNARFSWGRYP